VGNCEQVKDAVRRAAGCCDAGHRVQERAPVEEAARRGTAVGEPDRKRARTLHKHYRFVTEVLHHHHTYEDDNLWPVLTGVAFTWLCAVLGLCALSRHTTSAPRSTFAKRRVSTVAHAVTHYWLDHDRCPTKASDLIADLMAEQGCAPVWRGAVTALAPALAETVRPGDLVVTMGAGDVTHVGPALLAAHRSAAT